MTKENVAADWRQLNQALWDERVPLHVASSYYDVPGFRAGHDPLRAFEIDEVGEVAGKSLVHLQCHFGMDTMAWARRGAEVTGLDFCAPAIAQASSLAAELGINARFVTADVYDAVEALQRRTFDIVYTSIGVLWWLPDLSRWAQTAAALITPGGFLYLAECHPFAGILDETEGRTVTQDYFDTKPWVSTRPGSYTDREALTENNISVKFPHTLGEVVTSLAAAGLRLDFLHEHDVTLFETFKNLEFHPDGFLHLPADRPRVPLMYSLRASKPA